MLFILDIKIHLWIPGGETFFFIYINNEMDARSQETMHNTKVTVVTQQHWVTLVTLLLSLHDFSYH